MLIYYTFQWLNNKSAAQTVWMRRLVLDIVVPMQHSQVFSRQGPYVVYDWYARI